MYDRIKDLLIGEEKREKLASNKVIKQRLAAKKAMDANIKKIMTPKTKASEEKK